MNYELYFHPDALKEWKKLSSDIRSQFKKSLSKRLRNPHIASARLHGKLKACYKIKLRSSGYRLIYKVEDEKLYVLVLAIGKRDKNIAYKIAETRK